jgi:membrane protein YdbS with pleckstrin-like domain
MTSISHEPTRAAQDRRVWELILVPEMWAFLAIIVIWLSVVFAAIVGPDIVSDSVDGSHATVPSAVVMAMFAFFATWVIARYGFRRERRD